MVSVGDMVFVQGTPVHGPLADARREDGFLMCAVPAGYKGGDKLTIAEVSKEVTIPSGLKPGDRFLVDPATGNALKAPYEMPRWLRDTVVVCSVQ